MTPASNSIPTEVDASAFERSLTDIYETLYNDDIKGMADALPELVSQCQKASATEAGKNYVVLRMPAFVLGSNKLEGTLSPGASEGETFKVLYNWWMKNDESPREADGEHRIPWEEEGDNENNDAWYQQCKVHMGALKKVMAWAEAGEPLTPEKLQECHGLLMLGAITQAGDNFDSRFRHFDEPVMAGSYVFPNQVDHRENIKQVLVERNAEFGASHPVEWASKLALDILTNHPFLNGNGRLARLCFAYALCRHGIPCPVVISDWHSKARPHYIRAVVEAQGQKGPIKYHKFHSMAVVGLYSTLKNMCIFCNIGNGTIGAAGSK